MKLTNPSRTAWTLCAGLLLLAGVTGFADRLAANHPNDETTTKLVCNMIQKFHISQHPIDDQISGKLLDRFLKTLDPQKLYFTQPDIDELMKSKNALDDLLKAGNTQFAYDTWTLYSQRLEKQMEVAHKLIDTPHDFAVDESIEIDADKIAWAATQDELNDRWRRRIKFELLNATLENEDIASGITKPKPGPGGKAPATVKAIDPQERLHKRYRMFQKAAKETEDSDKLEMYLSSLTHCFDPHSSYMSPQTEEEFKIAIALNLDGIGAQLRSDDGFTIIHEIVKPGAASEDGRLTAGDKILAVGQEKGEMVDIMEMKLSKVVRLIRGPRGTKVRLQVKKGDTGEVVLYELTRMKIQLTDQEVKGEIIEADQRFGDRKGRIGIINIPSFYRDFQAFSDGVENAKSTAKDVQAVLQKFQKQGGVDVLVIDLRTNGGGALSEAIDVSGLFVDKGPIVQVKELNGRIKSHEDELDGVAYNGPLVVICNKLSASASEIFAAVIKDYQRGIIVGDTTTHGKGTVQNVMPVSMGMALFNRTDRGALKLTIQQFYRVNGDSTQKDGVKSDIVLPSLIDKMDLGEASLDNALEFDRVPPASHGSAGMASEKLISYLRDRSDKRVSADVKFTEIKKDIARYLDRKNRKSISLNESVLRSERNQDKKEQAETDKDDPSTRGKDAPIFPDETYNNEVLQISLDYATLLKNPQAAQK
ncbi:MAG: carboxy terminal-processing peptidase [Planctomycetaceae bacterium]